MEAPQEDIESEDEDFRPDEESDQDEDANIGELEKEEETKTKKRKKPQKEFTEQKVAKTETTLKESKEKTPATNTTPSKITKPPVAPTKKTGNLNNLLSSLSKPKKKESTLAKSKLDWDTFKEKEGISHELEQQAKDGYLEKQAFLARTDLRQFEKEREVRMAQRKKKF